MDDKTKKYLDSLPPEDRDYLEHQMDMAGAATLEELRAVEDAEALAQAQHQMDKVQGALESGERPPQKEVVRALKNAVRFAGEITVPAVVLEYVIKIIQKKTLPGRRDVRKFFPEHKEKVRNMFPGPDRDERLAARYDSLRSGSMRQKEALVILEEELPGEFGGGKPTHEALKKAITRGRKKMKKKE
ncbi:MAG: hypothetical protein ABIJ57_11215 [Pseudomonadota bacterium]